MLNKVLQTLMFKKNIRTAQLARETHIPKQTLNRIVNGTSPHPHVKNLQPLADYFAVSMAQLKGEAALPESMLEINLPHTKRKAKTIPLLTWEQLGISRAGDEEGTIYVSSEFSEATFAVAMPDTSMEPVFAKGMLLIFDPMKTPIDRSYVLVQLNEISQIVFRQLLIDAEHNYLKSLSLDLKTFPMRLLNEKDRILGVLVEARQIFWQQE